MSLDKEQVQHIAMLARLKLSDEEYAESVEKLSKIVDFVDQLSAGRYDGRRTDGAPAGCSAKIASG